jgi:hypothetical protein
MNSYWQPPASYRNSSQIQKNVPSILETNQKVHKKYQDLGQHNTTNRPLPAECENQADDDPSNSTQLDTINKPGTTQPTNGLPTPSGSEASQVPPNTTA